MRRVPSLKRWPRPRRKRPRRRAGESARARAAAWEGRTLTYHGGARAWSLSEAGRRAVLRESAVAPSPSVVRAVALHDRWGYDHHNAMDVGLSPDSAEGRALMEYLHAAGIPFMAFRFAIPGTATGPHIHVGRPSHRVAPR